MGLVALNVDTRLLLRHVEPGRPGAKQKSRERANLNRCGHLFKLDYDSSRFCRTTSVFHVQPVLRIQEPRTPLLPPEGRFQNPHGFSHPIPCGFLSSKTLPSVPSVGGQPAHGCGFPRPGMERQSHRGAATQCVSSG